MIFCFVIWIAVFWMMFWVYLLYFGFCLLVDLWTCFAWALVFCLWLLIALLGFVLLVNLFCSLNWVFGSICFYVCVYFGWYLVVVLRGSGRVSAVLSKTWYNWLVLVLSCLLVLVYLVFEFCLLFNMIMPWGFDCFDCLYLCFWCWLLGVCFVS